MLFLDSSEPNEIREIFFWGVVAGITTNPLILSREAGAQDLEPRIREVIQASRGPVSVELTHETEAEMLREAATYHAWDPARVCIKVPFSEVGLEGALAVGAARSEHQHDVHDELQSGVPGIPGRRHLRELVQRSHSRHGLRCAADHPRNARYFGSRGLEEPDPDRLDSAFDGRQRSPAGRRARGHRASADPT